MHDNGLIENGLIDDRRAADLVLDGGGVKGIALAGAVRVLAQQGYRFNRIAGTSAGATVAAVLAAMTQAGEPPDRLTDIARTLDYRKFRDRGGFAQALGAIGLGTVADYLMVLFTSGMYPGKYLHDWLRGVLGDFGVHRFGDLRLPSDPGSDLPTGHRYRLVIIASDVSQHRMAQLPWDYHEYGLDSDEQVVADAVRASASIPFFFRPSRLRTPHGKVTLLDGGMLSSFPLTTFDRTDGKPPRWPTFGVRLKAPARFKSAAKPVKGPLSLAISIVGTMTDSRDAMHLSQRCNQMRTVFVDTDAVSGTDFDLSDKTQDQLIEWGEQAASSFLNTWDFSAYIRECRGGAQ